LPLRRTWNSLKNPRVWERENDLSPTLWETVAGDVRSALALVN
jgi:hypothetical protein